MNTNTNTDYHHYYERDEQYFGYFLIDRKKIHTEIVTCRQMYVWSQKNNKNYQTITGSDLYKILKNRLVNKVFLTVTEPILICVCFSDSYRFEEFYKISFGGFLFFQEKYCESYEEDKKIWIEEGF